MDYIKIHKSNRIELQAHMLKNRKSDITLPYVYEEWGSFNKFIESINEKYLLIEITYTTGIKKIKLIATFLATFVDPMKFTKITGLDKYFVCLRYAVALNDTCYFFQF